MAILAGACPGLIDLKLVGASKLSDPTLHSLAAGCKQLQRVQVTRASVTAEGVVVALTTLGQLQRLEVGGMPALEELKELVDTQLGISGCHQWEVDGPDSEAAAIAWLRQGGA
jgi:hypothetical protein